MEAPAAETPHNYKEEVITRDYAVCLGLSENIADLINDENELSSVTGNVVVGIEEIKQAVKEGNPEKVRELLIEAEKSLM